MNSDESDEEPESWSYFDTPDQRNVEIKKIILMCLNAHCRVIFFFVKIMVFDIVHFFQV